MRVTEAESWRAGAVCPACDGHKLNGVSLCSRCYAGIPAEIRVRVGRYAGAGYCAAMNDAIEYIRRAARVQV